MDLVFIYGPPAAGKLTVARELASLTGYRLWHNHVSIDCVLPVFNRGDPSFDKLVHSIRKDVLAEAATQNVDLIMTFVYAHPIDISSVNDYLRPYGEAAGRVCLVQLVCGEGTLKERLGLPSRIEARKLISWDKLEPMLQKYELFAPVPGRTSLTLNTDEMSPDIAAQQIAEHYGISTITKAAEWNPTRN